MYKMSETKQYYVTMTDKFMSGWGMAKDLTNKLIFICDTWKEAQIVFSNANNRKDMKYVNICFTKPSYFKTSNTKDYVYKNYYVQIKEKTEYSTWYKEGSF